MSRKGPATVKPFLTLPTPLPYADRRVAAQAEKAAETFGIQPLLRRLTIYCAQIDIFYCAQIDILKGNAARQASLYVSCERNKRLAGRVPSSGRGERFSRFPSLTGGEGESL